jgi:opacity protein-like surface antigen
MKKLVMAVATVAALSSAASASCASSFSGFYAGLQAGLASTSGSVKTVANRAAAAALGTNVKYNVGAKSFVGGLFAGYGMGVGSCAYVGGEIYANMDSLSKKVIDPENGAANYFSGKVAHKFAFGAKIRLGYTVSQQAMVFLGLGGEYGKTEVSVTNIDTAAANTGKDVKTSKKKSNFSFAPSVGMDMFLSKNLFLRGEYTYVIGLKASAKDAAFDTVANGYKLNAKANLSQQRFMLGLGYKF